MTAVKRLRPKFMTMAAAFLGLVPIMWATGAGAEVMKHIAAPMVGGIITSFLLELLVYPAVYQIWKWNFEMKRQLEPEPALAAGACSIEICSCENSSGSHSSTAFTERDATASIPIT